LKKPLLILTAVFAVLVGVLIWWFSDSQVIKRNTRALATTLTISADDSKATRGLKGQDFAALLDTDFSGSMNVDNYQGEIDRDEAVMGHQYLSFNCQFSQAKVSDIEITQIEGDQATVTAHFVINVTTKGGSSYSDEADGTLIWIRTEEDIWKLQSAELLEKKP